MKYRLLEWVGLSIMLYGVYLGMGLSWTLGLLGLFISIEAYGFQKDNDPAREV